MGFFQLHASTDTAGAWCDEPTNKGSTTSTDASFHGKNRRCTPREQPHRVFGLTRHQGLADPFRTQAPIGEMVHLFKTETGWLKRGHERRA
jgi:hypothetical protein